MAETIVDDELRDDVRAMEQVVRRVISPRREDLERTAGVGALS